MQKKKTLEEKLSNFERKGNQWLELTRNWVIEANQAQNLALREDHVGMKNFLKKIGLNRQITGQKLSMNFRKPWSNLENAPISARSAERNSTSNSLGWT